MFTWIQSTYGTYNEKYVHNFNGKKNTNNKDYPEYHTSLDKNIFSFKTLLETFKVYYEVLMTIENNFIPKAKILYGTPQLSKSKISLYPQIMNFRNNEKLKQLD